MSARRHRIAAMAALAMAMELATGPSLGADPPAAKSVTRTPDKSATEQAEFLEFLGSAGAEDEAFVDFLMKAPRERPVTKEAPPQTAPQQSTPQKTASRGESNER